MHDVPNHSATSDAQWRFQAIDDHTIVCYRFQSVFAATAFQAPAGPEDEPDALAISFLPTFPMTRLAVFYPESAAPFAPKRWTPAELARPAIRQTLAKDLACTMAQTDLLPVEAMDPAVAMAWQQAQRRLAWPRSA